MEKLFEEPQSAPASATPQPGDRVVGVVVNANLWQTFDYYWPANLVSPQPGQRVRVPFGRGNRTTLAFVVDVDRAAAAPAAHALKTVAEVIDHQPQLDTILIKLAQWMSHYYMTPLGMVMAAMIPAAVGRHALKTETVAYLSSHHAQWNGVKGARQRKVLDELFEAKKQGIEPLSLEELQAHSGASRATVQTLVNRELIRLETREAQLPVLHDESAPDPFELNDEQRAALTEVERLLGTRDTCLASDGTSDSLAPDRTSDSLASDGTSDTCENAPAPSIPDGVESTHVAADDATVSENSDASHDTESLRSADRADVPSAAKTQAAHARGGLGSFSATLLYGVTGSGKTEVYVRAIRQVIAAGKGAILLVPEIALATQTLQRLVSRLPRVAVLHSGLSGAQRAFYYQKISDGQASVVVGPRSAIFAPVRNLGLVVVDEEHEPSYKQDTAPRYHGRDVAVMRASLSSCPVLLGSATPSLESYHNVQLGRYRMLRLDHRVRNLAMPRLQIVPLRKDLEPGKIELIGRTLTRHIAAALDRREQVILLMNRRGYASYVFCPKCEWTMTCDHCTRTMVFHQATQLATCHYCQASATLPVECPACKGKLLLFGFGIQRIEGELRRKFDAAKVARMDSDTMTTPAQFAKVFDEFGRGEIDILLGTQMVAKGLDFPRVSLVGVVSADTSLAVPDFRSAERTFQLVVQVAGRAGRGQTAGDVIVQTLHEDEPAIRCAVTHDYEGFARIELPLRKEAGFPPYSRMVRFIVRDESVKKAEDGATALAAGLRRILPPEIAMLGPMPAGIQKIRNQFRFQVLLTCDKAGYLQQLISPRLAGLCKDIEAEVIADVDPITLI